MLAVGEDAMLYSGLLQTQKRGPFDGILISALAISLTEVSLELGGSNGLSPGYTIA